MNGPDDEFDDFLRRRRPLFGSNDQLEPPAELDRIVLRQAREAIEAERPQRHFRAPTWGMPVALAATLVLAFTIILRVGLPTKETPSEVTVQNVSRKVEYPVPAPDAMAPETQAQRAAAAPAAPAAPAIVAEAEARPESPVVVDLSTAETEKAAAARFDKVADAARNRAPPEFVSAEEANRYSEPAAGVSASAAATPAWRRDPKTWLAEIERLREAGDVARADAELAEYKRQQRAYAGAPDR
jgi:hypothetical protein